MWPPNRKPIVAAGPGGGGASGDPGRPLGHPEGHGDGAARRGAGAIAAGRLAPAPAGPAGRAALRVARGFSAGCAASPA